MGSPALNRFIMIRAAYAGDRAAGIAWQAALQDAFSFRCGRDTFIVKDYRSMLNFFYRKRVRLTA